MKKVIVVHGWDSSPKLDWFPWLNRMLKEKGYGVVIPEMPETSFPRIDNWVPFLEKVVGKVDKDTFFIGHSIGCQTILRFLEKIDTKVGGCVFVAGWFDLTLDTDEEKEIAKPWIMTPINLDVAKKNAGKVISIFSDNDPWVPKSNWKKFENRLGSEIVVLKGLGHISEGDGVTELPPVVGALEKLQ
jgi:predicted alpha/beta hydrolase family esterase